MAQFQLPRIEWVTIIPGLPPIPWLVFPGEPTPPVIEPSIKDHITRGLPNYIDNYSIKVDGDSTPWDMRLAYDTKFAVSGYVNDALQSYDEILYSKGEQHYLSPPFIDNLKKTNTSIIIEQISPR